MPEYQHNGHTWNLEQSGNEFTIACPYGSIKLTGFECNHHAPMPIDEGDAADTRVMYAAEGQYVSVGTEKGTKNHLSVGVQGMHADFYDVPATLVEDLFRIPVIKLAD